MKRILFVDDETNVLQGLRRTLHGMRGEWEMEFAASGPAALELLAQAPYDVVVTDMRMPGMDGAQLLNEVRAKHPQVVRLVLSGQSDQEAILRSVGPTHQYMSKPCNPAELQAVVQRACALRDLLADENIRRIVSRLKSLPSIPSLYMDLVREINSDGASIRRVGEIVAQDIGMSAKLLQLINSAFFGLPRHIASPNEAACFLGLDTVRSLVLSIQVFSQFERGEVEGFSIEELFHHSINTGRIARDIARFEGADKRVCDDAMLAGMLHDVGQLVLVQHMPREFNRALLLSRTGRQPIESAEAAVFGATHAEVGAYLLGLWGLPGAIVESVAFHHQIGAPHLGLLGGSQGTHVAVWVHAAGALETERDTRPGLAPHSPIDLEVLALHGFGDHIPAWRDLARMSFDVGATHE